MSHICLSCAKDEEECKTFLYRKWYAYMRKSCTLYEEDLKRDGKEDAST